MENLWASVPKGSPKKPRDCRESNAVRLVGARVRSCRRQRAENTKPNLRAASVAVSVEHSLRVRSPQSPGVGQRQ